MSKFLKPLNQNGFTMIELIVVFSVIAILSSIGVVATVNYSRAQSLEAGYQDLKTILNQAKSYSQSQYKPSECTNQVLEKYRIDLDSVDNEYTLSVICGGTYQILTYKLPNDVSFGESDSPSSYFDFPIISGGIRSDGISQSPWEIKLVGVDDRYKIITLEVNGSIK